MSVLHKGLNFTLATLNLFLHRHFPFSRWTLLRFFISGLFLAGFDNYIFIYMQIHSKQLAYKYDTNY